MSYLATFINIPRNGSTTICDILGLEKQAGNINLGIQPETRIICHDHIKGSLLKSFYQIQNTFTFAFCRNPYTRVISWFEYHKQQKLLDQNLNFNDWVEQGCPHRWEHWSDIGKTPLLQKSFVDGCRVDFLGRMENFKVDINLITEKLNLLFNEKKFTFNNKKLNVSNSKEFSTYYQSSMTKAKVFNLFAEDFDYFGYLK